MEPANGTDCLTPFSIALMAGTTLQRFRVNDVMRGVDYLQGLKGVDPDRIGIMGISGGGQISMYAAALDTRIKAAIISCFMNTHRASVLGMHHCVCNFVPGLARILDMPDMGAMIAPRPLLIEAGSDDPIFPLKATKEAIVKIKKAYKLMKAEDRVEVDIFKGEHVWSGVKMKTFLEKGL
jgi:dienelactone hydrolase